jgi:3-oxoacyl-[acyl-carrier-protein] synthase II
LAQEVWITGCGLVSALGEGDAQHWARLQEPESIAAAADSATYAPYTVYPIRQLDLDRFIPKKADQRAMGPLMQYGVYAAGMALAEAGVAGNAELLGHTHLLVASGGGERDLTLDEQILSGVEDPQRESRLAEQLVAGLRPTLFLAQLPNLFAGNISIVHGVAGSSRTFLGEEAAGVDTARIAYERIAAGQGDLFLLASAFNADRADMLLLLEPAGLLLNGPLQSLWRRPLGGICLGSAGAALVLESRTHAEARGAKPLARLSGVCAGWSDRAAGSARAAAEGQWRTLEPKLHGDRLAVISGACGSGPITREEHAFLTGLAGQAQPRLTVRGTGIGVGHSLEASFLVNLILAISCLRRGELFPPLDAGEPLESPATGPVEQVLVTGWGHHRGEAMAVLDRLA